MERTAYRLLSAAVLVGALTTASAQHEQDALRFSSITPGGTARSIGLANAFGALGADPVSAAINPAGLGMYRTSEISFTPLLDVSTVNSQYLGTGSSDAKSRFYFGNLALILNSPAENAGSDWRSSTFGVVYNRQATHHWGRQAVANGVASSILDDFAWPTAERSLTYVTAGGSFVTGGYTGTLSTSFMSPIAGRMAWEGPGGGYITSTVNLPPAANGQNIILRWRNATDSSVAVAGGGVRVDTITGIPCPGGATPPPTPTPTPTPSPSATPSPSPSPTCVPSGGAVPELMYYRFDGTGATVPNEASAPVGTNPAPIQGGITQGGTGQFGGGLIGSGVSSTTDFLNTGWAAVWRSSQPVRSARQSIGPCAGRRSIGR